MAVNFKRLVADRRCAAFVPHTLHNYFHSSPQQKIVSFITK
jgi:hypothetical protein